MSAPTRPAVFLGRPEAATIERLLVRSAGAPFSYAETGISRDGDLPGFETDLRRLELGHGDAVFAAACAALRAWRMFPGPWTFIAPPNAPLAAGTPVAMCVRSFGLWWVNSCRIVEAIDEPGPVRRYGLAYGTLPAHTLQGEARFVVEMQPDGRVDYVLRAVSRIRFAPARWSGPLARNLQLRFVDGSPFAVQHAVAGIRGSA